MNPATFYDDYWKTSLHTSDKWSDDRLQKTLGPLLPLERVLDYGCGTGEPYQQQVAAAVEHYTGADVAPMAVTKARAKGYHALLIDPQTGAVDVSDASYDGAMSVEVFEHLFDPLQSAKELYRLLKPGGVVILTVPNFGYHECRLLALLRAQVPSEPENARINRFNGVHIRFFSKLMLARLLRDAGFTEVRVGSFDDASVWDVFRAGGPLAIVSDYARKYLPPFLHLRFLQDVWPNFFAKRLRVIGRKPVS